MKRTALVITLMAFSLYRLAPELHLLFNPIDRAFGLIDAENRLLLAQYEAKLAELERFDLRSNSRSALTPIMLVQLVPRIRPVHVVVQVRIEARVGR